MVDLAQFTAQNKFLMLALDHRGSIKKYFQTDRQIIDFKTQIIKSLSGQFSGLLIDVDYGLPAYKTKVRPFLLPVEKSGFKEIDGERITEVEHSVDELKKLGAGGVKLLVYFNPNGATAKKQLLTAKQIKENCEKEDFPFFLEIVTYGEVAKQNLVVDSVKRFLGGEIYPDVFKLEYPGDAESCRRLTQILGETPWILLTAGEDFELFKLQLKIAVKNGCSGFLAGRALWKELLKLKGGKKKRFLTTILPARFKEISQISTG